MNATPLPKVQSCLAAYQLRMVLVSAVALLALSVQSSGQGTMYIGFEGPATPGGPSPQPPGTYSIIPTYIESGVWFRNPYGPEQLSLRGPGIGWAGDNGTANLSTSLGGALAFSFSNGSLFSLLSFDLAEGGTNSLFPMTIQMIGYIHGGGAVTNTFTTDGIIDGPGGLPDFQTFSPDSRFSALDRVEIRTGGFALDNVWVVVPEPGTGVLVIVGTTVLAARFLRRKPRL